MVASVLERSADSKQPQLPLEQVLAETSSPAPHAITAQQRLLADASLLITTILWGANIPVVKFASGHVEPLVFNATRVHIIHGGDGTTGCDRITLCQATGRSF